MSIVNNFKNTEKYLEQFAQLVIRRLREELTKPKQRKFSNITAPIEASGELGRSYRVEKKGLTFNIFGKEYGLTVDEGGKTTARLQEIKEWIRVKPVTLATARPNPLNVVAGNITRSINRRGHIQPTPFINEALENAMKYFNVDEPLKQDVIDNIEKILIESGFAKEGSNFVIK